MSTLICCSSHLHPSSFRALTGTKHLENSRSFHQQSRPKLCGSVKLVMSQPFFINLSAKSPSLRAPNVGWMQLCPSFAGVGGAHGARLVTTMMMMMMMMMMMKMMKMMMMMMMMMIKMMKMMKKMMKMMMMMMKMMKTLRGGATFW